jgi:hypothetical protein
MSDADSFEETLKAVFEERAQEMSPSSRELLRQLWEEGFKAGRSRERAEAPVDMSKAVPSECGNYLCIPVPKHVQVLESSARRAQEIRVGLPSEGTLFVELLEGLDRRVLEELAKRPVPSATAADLVTLQAAPRPRVEYHGEWVDHERIIGPNENHDSWSIPVAQHAIAEFMRSPRRHEVEWLADRNLKNLLSDDD